MDPMDELDEATRRYKATDAAHKESREAAIQAVVKALRSGAKPTPVANRSPFTPAYVRRVAREHGIEPDERYIREQK